MPKETPDPEKSKKAPVGGIPFFSSLFFLIVLSTINIIILPVIILSSRGLRWAAFGGGLLLGALIARRLIYGWVAVYFHELKHSIVSNIAGNRARGMKVRSETGHFEYSYTQKTAYMNSLIALAPYYFPAFFIPTFTLVLLAGGRAPFISLFAVGLAYGADLALNMRDISPVQTDLTDIRGGYRVAVTYIFAMNCALFTFLASWVADGRDGFIFLIFGLLRFGQRALGFG